MVAVLNFPSFCKTQKCLYLVLDGADSTKFLTCWVSLQSSHANFQNIFVSPNIAKHKNAYILKTVLDTADCADFGCHNSIRLETKHFLNTLALTFISFSGRFVFAMQKHYLFFFASDPLVSIFVTFGGHLGFSRKIKKCQYLENRKR